MAILRLVIALSLIAAFAVSGARADARRGEAFAQQWCSVCRATRPGLTSPRPKSPRFPDIAADPSTTDACLNTTSHMAIPKLKLTARDQDDVIACVPGGLQS
jgi:hypothetical protein